MNASLPISGAVICLLIAFVLSIVAGAITGIVLGGKDLGRELAALMGGMFGPTAVVPAVFAGLVILRFL